MQPATLLGNASMNPALRRISFWILFILVAAFVFLDYWTYSRQFQANPESIAALAGGTGPAPAQYRVGVIYAAKLFLKATHGHLSYRHSFALFDFVFAFAAGLLTRSVLFGSRSFKAAPPVSQWLRLSILLGLTTYYMNWSLWYQRPETWACTLFVAASVYLLTTARSGAVLALGLIALAVVQGVIRSDVAMIFHFALFVYVLLRGARGFLVSKRVLLASSFVSGLLATAILWVLTHKAFPHATYGDTPVFQLLRNLAPMQWVLASLFLAPVLYTFWRAKDLDTATEGWTGTLLLASALYFASWAAVGRLEEVRIFVPFAFALMPQTANALATRLGFVVRTESSSPSLRLRVRRRLKFERSLPAIPSDRMVLGTSFKQIQINEFRQWRGACPTTQTAH